MELQTGDCCGYLTKESSSKWKRAKTWHQRWFVLDTDTGRLSYYKSESMAGLPEHRRGALDLNHEDAALEIDGSMAVHAPTPFPFRVSAGSSGQMMMFNF